MKKLELKELFEHYVFKYFLLIILIVLEYSWGQYITMCLDTQSPISGFSNDILHRLFWIFTAFSFMILSIAAITYPWPTLRIISRFFDSTIKKNILTIFLLIFFLSNLTWFMDIVYKLMFEHGNFWCEFWHAFICSISMIFAILLFPYSNYVKDEKNIIISGISVSGENLTYYNFEGLLKMFKKGKGYESGEFDKIEKICIIPSTALKDAKIHIDNKLKSDTIEEPETKETTEKTRNELAKLYLSDKIFKQDVDDYNLFIDEHSGGSSGIHLQEQHKKLSDIFSYYFNKTRSKQIAIEFLDPIDYNSEYKEMINKIHNSLEKLSQTTSTYNAYIYVSLGTSLLTSALTIMAVKGNRKIMYLDQKTKKDIKTYTPEIVTLSKYLDEKNDLNNQ